MIVNRKEQNILKDRVAKSALRYVKKDMIVGIGTGSTTNYFINHLETMKCDIKGVISSSEKTTKLLQSKGFNILELNDIEQIDIYIDGADKINFNKEAIKGKGGALTKEKICATNSKSFICIVDESKLVEDLSRFSIPIEVIPMALKFVSRQCKKLGWIAKYRKNFITDNTNCIIDLHNINMTNLELTSKKICNILGIVCSGIFIGKSSPTTLLVAKRNGQVISF